MTSDTSAVTSSAVTSRSRVLVVDDAPTVRMYHREILRRAGFEVAEAGNGFEALEMAMGARYDLLVVDVNMPQMDGHTLVVRLRSEDVDVDCPIVMISTESAEGDAAAAYVAGANGYLVKPVDPARLELVATTLTAALDPWVASDVQRDVQHGTEQEDAS